MRNQSRLLHLLLRTHHKIPIQSQVLRSFSPIPLRFTTNQSKFSVNPSFRNFSSKPHFPNVNPDHSVIVEILVDILSKYRNLHDLKNQLDSVRFPINLDVFNAVSRRVSCDPPSYIRFLHWVEEKHPEIFPEILSSKRNKDNETLENKSRNNAARIDLIASAFYEISNDISIGEPNKKDRHYVSMKIARILGKSRNLDDIKKELDLYQNRIDHSMVNTVLQSLADPDSERIFFGWVLENYPERLMPWSWNILLDKLASRGAVKEFWALIGVMKKKGILVMRLTVDRCFFYFGKNNDTLNLEKSFYNDAVERVCWIVRNNMWSDDLKREIRYLNIWFSSKLIKLVLENLGSEPKKAMIFFRLIEESQFFDHDICTYNAMVDILVREYSIDWPRKLHYEEQNMMAMILERLCPIESNRCLHQCLHKEIHQQIQQETEIKFYENRRKDVFVSSISKKLAEEKNNNKIKLMESFLKDLLKNPD